MDIQEESAIPEEKRAVIREYLAKIKPPSAAELRKVRAKKPSEFTYEDKDILLRAHLSQEGGLRKLAKSVAEKRFPDAKTEEERRRAVDLAELELSMLLTVGMLSTTY